MSSDNATTPASSALSKRLRFSITPTDEGNSTASGGLTDKEGQYSAPLKVATKMSNSYITASLPTGMQTIIQTKASEILQSWATYWNSRELLYERINNPNFIPQDARIKLTLQPIERVSKDPGFTGLSQQAGEVVKQCQRMLREPVLVLHKMNVDGLLADVREDFVRLLLDLAKLFKAKVVGKEHTMNVNIAVADLLAHHEDDILPWLKLQAGDFKKIFCEVAQLGSFPPSVQSPSLASGTGDNTNQGTSQSHENGGGDAATDERIPPDATVRGFLTKNVAKGNINLATANWINNRPPEDRLKFVETFLDYDRDVAARSINSARRTHSQAASQAASTAMDIDDTGGNGTVRDESSGDSSTNNRTDGAQQVDTTEGHVLQIRTWLHMTVQNALIRPIDKYKWQSERNAEATRIRKEVKLMELSKQTDEVAELLESEPSADPKLLKIIVRDEAKKEAKKAVKELKAEAKTHQSKKEKGGHGKSSLKTKASTSPSNKPRSQTPGKNRKGRGGGADDSNNATSDAKSASKKKRSSSSSKKKNNATTTPRGKSKGASKRK